MLASPAPLWIPCVPSSRNTASGSVSIVVMNASRRAALATPNHGIWVGWVCSGSGDRGSGPTGKLRTTRIAKA